MTEEEIADDRQVLKKNFLGSRALPVASPFARAKIKQVENMSGVIWLIIFITASSTTSEPKVLPTNSIGVRQSSKCLRVSVALLFTAECTFDWLAFPAQPRHHTR